MFTFQDQNAIKAYYSTGENQLYQYCDRKCIGMGGGNSTEQNSDGKIDENCRFALYLGDDFLRGSTHPTCCFNNDKLAAKDEFLCVELEVWGFQ